MRKGLRMLWNLIGRTIGLAVVWFATAAITVAVARQLVSHTAAARIAWGAGTLAVIWMWRYWRRRGREIAAETAASELAAGEQLRRNNLARYRELLDGATDAVALADADRYVGRAVLAATPPPPRHAWTPSDAQSETVARLTEELNSKTLVRMVEPGVAEVLGLKDDVAYRYSVDASGTSELLSTDDSKVRMLRWIRRTAVTGITGFVGCFIPLFIFHRDGRVPGWMVPIMLVSFALAFVGMAASTGPRHFTGPGENWLPAGSGWSDD